VTVPDPVPDFVTIKLYAVVAAVDVDVLKAAVTDVAAVIVTVQVSVPEHPPPDQPEKVDPLFAEAARATDVPDS